MISETSPNAGTIESVILEKNSRLAKVSIRIKVVRAGVLWSKRYPSRSAYIFFNDTIAGSGGTSKVGTTPVVLPWAIKLLDGFATGEWRFTWRLIADLHRVRVQTV